MDMQPEAIPNQNVNNGQLNGVNSTDNHHLNAFLDDKEAERDRVIMQLRQLDRLLIRYDRLKRETLPQRVR